MKSLLEYTKDYILESIDDFEDEKCYACELANELMAGANADGSLTYSRAEAKEYLNEWFEECGEYWEYEKRNFGGNYHNPFENPEAYMVCMVIAAAETILAGCPIIDENWNDNIVITDTVIEQIKDYVRQYNNDELF